MKKYLLKAFSFIIKDFLVESSYGFNVLMQTIGIIFSVFTFYYLSKIIDLSQTPELIKYKEYFPYVIIGIALSNYLSVATRGFAQRIRESQLTGTLESILICGIKPGEFLILSTLYDFLFSTIRIFIYIATAFLFSKGSFYINQIHYSILILLLSVIAFSSMGVLSAGFVLMFKRGDPISIIYSTLSYLFSGVYFPISLLPIPLRFFSNLLPMTHALEGLRKSLLTETTYTDLLPQIIALLIFSLVLWPLSLLIFSKAVNKAKYEGSLSHF
ncbi:MAG: ABC transporter permease [Deltaproteobacteria bacterium]|nr:ABC transporter permease [Deltaproteobacteria bacterium]